MKILSLSEAKIKLSALVDQVHNSDQEVVITKNGRPVAVMVSPDEFESWKETVVIQANESLMNEVRAGLEQLKRRRARLYTLEELLD